MMGELWTYMAMERDHFLRKFLHILVPVLLQQVLLNSLSFVDTLMISRLGGGSIAAVGIAAQLSFLISLFFYGTSTACSIFVSQYFGAKQYDGIRNVTALALTFALCGALLFCVVSMVCPAQVMHIFSTDEEVVELGCGYLRAIGPGYFAWAFTQILGIGLRSTNRPGIPLAASVVSMFTNIFGNWVLIFGHLGFPAMGVTGAAIASTFSRCVEAAIVVAGTYLVRSPCALRGAADFRWTGPFLRHVVPTAVPVVANEFFWALGNALYKVAYSRQGTGVVAVVNVADSVSSLFLTAIFAVSSTTLVMIGQKIGEQDMPGVHAYCRRFSGISFLTGMLMGALLIALSPLLAAAFHLEGSLAVLARRCLFSIALLFPFRSFGYALVTGILRAGGDTRFAAIAELGCVWLIGVPMAWLGAVLLALPMPLVYLMTGLEDIGKSVIGIFRLRRGSWIHDLSRT